MTQGSSPKEDRDSPEDCRGSDDAIGSRWKFARRFAEGIKKLAGNVKGDRWKEDRRTCRKIAKVTGVCGKSGRWPAVDSG
ncbi:hypothetical protein B296_00043021 [Ensete ventricosum]|uniref:Uncharacterized protein n=1 Tax=Ensete ventricosum TaxID=4639 RepID=A0A426X893_ENSVE|nr:hypothetical protein B296_00043021 [Ensete ventricosum]